MHFSQTKNGFARTVPLHPALIDEGFLAFHSAAPDGYLFVGDRPQKQGATRTQQEQRASEIAAWIQEKVNLEPGVSPNHGWRHLFCTNAEAAGISKRMANAIAGHNRKSDVSDGYVEPSIQMLAIEINKYPRYKIMPMAVKS
jgi:integrase